MDAFISYRRLGGGEIAYIIHEGLSGAKYNAFFDIDDIHIGKFDERIEKNIERSHNFVLIVTADVFERCQDPEDWVRREIRMALNLKKNIVPVLVNDVEFPKDLPEDIREISRWQAVKYETGRQSEAIKDIISKLLDGEGRPLSLSKGKNISNNYYSSGMSREEKNRIIADHEVCAPIVKKIFTDVYDKYLKEIVTDNSPLIIFDPAVYEITSAISDYDYFEALGCPYQIYGMLNCEEDVAEANALFGGKGKFYQGNMNDADFADKMDRILSENRLKGFDFVNLTLILKDLPDPANKLRLITERMNMDGVVYVRELDDDLIMAYPDSKGLFKKMLQMIKLDKYAGNRDMGKRVFSCMRDSYLEDVHIENVILTTDGMKKRQRDKLFSTYFSYVKPELMDLVQEDPDNLDYEHAVNWLDKNYEDMRREFLSEDFFFVSGFMFFYGVNRD